MSLTEKEKRVITSPQSLSSKQRKTTKHRTKIKIQEILCDMQFLIDNHNTVKEEFGIDMLDIVSLGNISQGKKNHKDTHDDKTAVKENDDDPDLL